MTVALAGGKQHFYPNDNKNGRLKDDFVEDWQNDENVAFVETQTDLMKYMEGTVLSSKKSFEFKISGGMKEDTLIGLFAEGHLEYDIERLERAPHQPTLEEMTEVAIKKLSQNPNGYYLFVEAGKIGKFSFWQKVIILVRYFKYRI